MTLPFETRLAEALNQWNGHDLDDELNTLCQAATKLLRLIRELPEPMVIKNPTKFGEDLMHTHNALRARIVEIIGGE